MQVEAISVSENTAVVDAAQKAQTVARLLRKAPFEEPRIVSFDIDFLAPKGAIAYAGNTSG